jgi:arabinose-5-phosphate isomerase
MSTEAIPDGGGRRSHLLDNAEQLKLGREIIRGEGSALLALADRLGDDFCRALALLHVCPGSVLVSGIGKAGLVGQKIAATLASTGTRSHFLHPAEAVHGDLGRIHRDDVLLILSQSGETEEITRLLPSLREFGTPIIAVTGHPNSRLGQSAHVALDLGPLQEACPLGLAPSTSTTAMLALGDAIALVLSRMRQFGARDFARFHPGGSLGRKLARVDEVMRPRDECRIAHDSDTVREVFVRLSRPGRRSGAIMLIDNHGQLSGIFTDSDLAKLFERKQDAALDGPIAAVMTRHPTVVPQGAAVSEAIAALAGRKLSELPVVDFEGRPAGLIDITDLLGLLPRSDAESLATQTIQLSKSSISPQTSSAISATELATNSPSSAQTREEWMEQIVPFPNLRAGWRRTQWNDDES